MVFEAKSVGSVRGSSTIRGFVFSNGGGGGGRERRSKQHTQPNQPATPSPGNLRVEGDDKGRLDGPAEGKLTNVPGSSSWAASSAVSSSSAPL